MKIRIAQPYLRRAVSLPAPFLIWLQIFRPASRLLLHAACCPSSSASSAICSVIDMVKVATLGSNSIMTKSTCTCSAHIQEASGTNSCKGGQELLDDVQSPHRMEQHPLHSA